MKTLIVLRNGYVDEIVVSEPENDKACFYENGRVYKYVGFNKVDVTETFEKKGA